MLLSCLFEVTRSKHRRVAVSLTSGRSPPKPTRGGRWRLAELRALTRRQQSSTRSRPVERDPLYCSSTSGALRRARKRPLAKDHVCSAGDAQAALANARWSHSSSGALSCAGSSTQPLCWPTRQRHRDRSSSRGAYRRREGAGCRFRRPRPPGASCRPQTCMLHPLCLVSRFISMLSSIFTLPRRLALSSGSGLSMSLRRSRILSPIRVPRSGVCRTARLSSLSPITILSACWPKACDEEQRAMRPRSSMGSALLDLTISSVTDRSLQTITAREYRYALVIEDVVTRITHHPDILAAEGAFRRNGAIKSVRQGMKRGRLQLSKPTMKDNTRMLPDIEIKIALHTLKECWKKARASALLRYPLLKTLTVARPTRSAEAARTRCTFGSRLLEIGKRTGRLVSRPALR